MPDPALIVIILLCLAAVAVFTWPRYRLRKALAEPFPAEWRRILQRNIPVYRRMPTDLPLQLKRRIQQFIHEKHFTGCGGLEVTDEMRVTIAASACLLLLNRKTSVYPGLKYILVYPDAFMVQHETLDEAGLPNIGYRGLLGESWSNGKVILSWEDVLQGSRDFGDGANVALHEFAHQLDHETGSTNGAPFIGSRAGYRRWAKVLTEEFERLQRAAYRGDQTLLDHYGATEPAEFFAVVTETFFEMPEQMREKHPALFEQLQNYYRVNPADWL
ncbi:MAG: zinc-dependent peptidase [Thiolinea sp.]